MIGRRIKDAYRDFVRTGTVIADLGERWQVQWDGRTKTKIGKNRVGNKPKKIGPWWDQTPAEIATSLRHMDAADEGRRVEAMMFIYGDDGEISGDWSVEEEECTAMGLLAPPKGRTPNWATWETELGRAVAAELARGDTNRG